MRLEPPPLPANVRAASGGRTPTPANERVISLDVLRGVAVLGILVMNVQSFGTIEAAYIIPTLHGPLAGAEWWVWVAGHVLADQKFMSIFAMLFGAGVAMMTDRADASGRATGGSPWRLHSRRMAMLAVIGLLHAYLFWFGDILFAYAVCGWLVYPLRRLAPAGLLLIGAIALVVPGFWTLGLAAWEPHWTDEMRAEVAAPFEPTSEEVAAELAAYRGGWLEQQAFRAPSAAYYQFVGLPLWTVWRAGGLMLIGMAFWRWGVLAGRAPHWAYAVMIGLAVLVGWPLTIAGVVVNVGREFDPLAMMLGGMEWNYWGSAFISLGYVAAVVLATRKGVLKRANAVLAAVGRTALSNYLLQTVVCTTLFYGHGFGLFGRLSRVEMLGVVVIVWVLQCAASVGWLRRFRFGPVEWAWRTLTYGRLQAIRL